MTARCAPYIGDLKIFGTPWLRRRLLFTKFFIGFYSNRPYKCMYTKLSPYSVDLPVPGPENRGTKIGQSLDTPTLYFQWTVLAKWWRATRYGLVCQSRCPLGVGAGAGGWEGHRSPSPPQYGGLGLCPQQISQKSTLKSRIFRHFYRATLCVARSLGS